MQKINLGKLEIAYDENDPEGYRAGHNRFGPQIGAIGARRHGLRAAGGSEHLPVPLRVRLRGVGDRPQWPADLRHPEGEDALDAGDVVCFPEGPSGAHKLTNRAPETARVMLLSDKPSLAAAVYPDSGKIGLFPPDERDGIMVRRESGVDYYDRER